jgi:hypothetical protein
MCFNETNLNTKWNWDGDVIVPDCIVPSNRPIPGHKVKSYDIDVRAFLGSDQDVLMRRAIYGQVKEYINEKKYDWGLFTAREEGAFDYRALVIVKFVAEKVDYAKRNTNDPWLFPSETLAVMTGDCEDRAFLLGSLLISSGISPYNVRVSFGKVCITDKGKSEEYDHMWVMYKSEIGKWTMLDPLHTIKNKKRKDEKPKVSLDAKVEYVPSFLFNNSHLWTVAQPAFASTELLQKSWNSLDPSFVGDVHRSIVHQALDESGAPDEFMQQIDEMFSPAVLGLAGPLVDDFDRHPKKYNPIHHFDNGYIDESWKYVNEKLKKFSDDNTDVKSFAAAAHAIADFYSHSSYAHFAKKKPGADGKDVIASIYDHTKPADGLEKAPAYGPGTNFDFKACRFSVNPYYWNKRPDQSKNPWDVWDGKIITGRYAQKNDTNWSSVTSLIEALSPDRITDDEGEKYKRGALPHHNEIAVDEEKKGVSNNLYDPDNYKDQLRMRKDIAIQHIRHAYLSNKK